MKRWTKTVSLLLVLVLALTGALAALQSAARAEEAQEIPD